MSGKKFYFESTKKAPVHITVDVSKGGVSKKVGDNLSTRIPIQMKDEAGNIVKGYFTENEYVNEKKMLETRVRDLVNDPKYRTFLPLYEKFKNLGDYQPSLTLIYTKYGRKLKTPKKGVTIGTHLAEQLLKGDRDTLTALTNYLRYEVKMRKDEVDHLLGPLNRKISAPFIAELFDTAYKVSQAEYSHIAGHGMGKDENINRRNNAMSDYAQLLGEDKLVARSVPMTVVNGDKLTQGSYMLNANGITNKQFNAETEGFCEKNELGDRVAKRLELTEEALQQISKAQVLDYLCANVDRHPGNLIYEVDTSDPDVVKITNVTLIDNDASFGHVDTSGKGAYMYMSKLEDIKIMDALMAKRILNLKPEDVEDFVRLANLNASEMKTVRDSLEKLKERIKSGDIKLLEKKEDWSKYLQPKNYAKLCYSDPQAPAYNIFDNVRDELQRYERNKASQLRQLKSKEKLEKQNRLLGIAEKEPEVKADPGYAEVINIQDDIVMNDHIERLYELHKQIGDMGITRNAGFLEMYNAIQKVTERMYLLQKKLEKNEGGEILAKQMSDRDRNELSLLLNEIKAACDRCVEMNGTKLEKKEDEKARIARVNVAKNLAALAKGVRSAVMEDSMEAEKLLASKMAADLHSTLGGIRAPLMTKHTLDSLTTRLDVVDSNWKRSSPQFRAMVTAFKNIKKLPEDTTPQARSEKFTELAKLSQAYLDYKTENGKRTEYKNDYEINRVEFVKNMLEFAEASAENVIRQAEKPGYLLEIKNFNDRCQALTDALQNSKTEEEKAASMNAIREGKDQFVNDYRKLLEISERYPEDEQLQMVCGKFAAQGPIAKYMYAYSAAIKADGKEASANLQENLGFTKEDMARSQMLSLRHKFAEQNAARKAQVAVAAEKAQPVKGGPKR